ncbi:MULTISPECIES: ABC transporter ATP-binding protein [Bifidobacterium]|uniref:ATPase component of various ABC-type transport systems with duplicated ATPase domain n=1 Tax=Bifidobacterium reuteri DSM 23975 TaxID=1437610 RepID=A0A087CVG8_9BIFI|nr:MULTISPECIES: ABC transporter ATP-binding protein [Bifidobacterium]KFI87268.1 ATPase component of various ABC-type transport systems with duplicated ATPase domain [Bifidobacterium reuteri DSM 23975]
MSEATTGELVGEISHLSVTYHAHGRAHTAVDDISLQLKAGRTLAIVGESGSGKSTVVKALLGILPASAEVTGSLNLLGHALEHAGPKEWAQVRGRIVGFVPQDPQSNLDPTMRIGEQVAQIVRLHHSGLDRRAQQSRVLELLEEVGIDEPALRARQYPYELSGGLKQRVLIAQALASDPEVIVADEPTSALDVTVQKKILDVLETLGKARNIATLMVTHDLAVVSDRADDVLVMHNGELVETGETGHVLGHPGRTYTKALLAASPSFRSEDIPTKTGREHLTGGAAPEPEVAVRWKDVTKTYRTGYTPAGVFKAVDGVTLTARKGETLAIVGESGSGKTTLLRLALALTSPTNGSVEVNGNDLSTLRGARLRNARRDFQLVQQNPFDSLDPKYSIADCISEPLKAFHVGDGRSRANRVRELLDLVALPQSVLTAKPTELSGGQCQRVAIARALAVEPKVLFLDEPVSALDVIVQAQIVDLLATLQRDLKLTYVFVSHDLAVVSNIADRIAVIGKGHLVEEGAASHVLHHPTADYTRKLLAAIPGGRLGR